MINIASLAERLIEQNRNPNYKVNDINKNNFKFLYVIGKGGFGRVWKIQSKKTKQIFALKEMSKLKIIDKKSEKSINSEREFLSKLNHPFIVNMHYAFQDKENLYLVMDMLSGGDLRYHISRYRKFSEEQTRFFIANMVYALQYIHDHNVIHRDIKPENLVLDEKGYVRITDFGIAKENMPDNSSETSGTPGYMAPEVMRAKNHSFPVDFFAIGVIGYEFMLGRRPYYGKNRKEIKEQMLSTPAVIKEENIAHGWSTDSADFINLLLKRKEEKRLGYKNGAIELMRHPWLKYYPWTELKNKTLLAPFIPEEVDNFDKHYCESIEKISEETQIRYESILGKAHYKNAFLDFFFNGDDEKEIERKEKEEKERKEKEEREEKERLEKEQKEIEKTEQILREIEENEKLLEKEKQIELNKSPPDRNIKYNFHHDLKSFNQNENPLLFKRIEKYEIQKSQSINNRKSSSNHATNNNNNKNKSKSKKKQINEKNENNLKEKSDENSINVSKKNMERTNKKINNLKKPLFHSNSTRDIYSAQSNIEKYLKKKINQLQNSHNFKNSNNQVKPIIKSQKSKSKLSSNLIPPSSSSSTSKGTTSASININNYYTNHIYNSIYNNFMPHQLYDINSNINKKINRQRASSVLTSKRSTSKYQSNIKKIKGKQVHNCKNKEKKVFNNIPTRKMSRTNSKVSLRPSSEFTFNKTKSISIYNHHKKV